MRKKLICLLLGTGAWLVHGGPAVASQGTDAAEKAAAAEALGKAAASQELGQELGRVLPLWAVIPFAGILLSIALFPLFAKHFWHRHYPKVSLFWALVFAVPFLAAYREAALKAILHIYLIDYIPFIILLWGLYTVSGGIIVRGTMRGTPMLNTALLAFGTFLASWIGTTGASMLLIRPVLRANAHRKKKVHVVVFFIFLVSNIGGSLTPLGDPPLFLGFLHGVPFFWTFTLWPQMLFVSALLLLIFYWLDGFYYFQVEKKRKGGLPDIEHDRIKIDGLRNLLFLAGIVGMVLMSGVWRPGSVEVYGIHLEVQAFVRDAMIIFIGLLSLAFTPASIRKDNKFDWEPIREVGILFAGIFMTIIPAIEILKAGSEGHLAFLLRAARDPAHYFWLTGGLSSFLDNAPTYLTFFNSALGRFYSGLAEPSAVSLLIREKAIFLEAISAGAVFMGATTYIGNAPNFMVKSIAEESGVSMPSFFGYMVKYSLIILVPTFLLVTILFY
jgi:Na+/H+ antiporter NhaD/arsenite permease-like protein